MENGPQAILEISTTNKDFFSLYKMFRLYIFNNPTELDALVQFMGKQIN